MKSKWRLMLSTLPVVLGVYGLRRLLQLTLGFRGAVDFSEVAIVLTGGIFLVGFMLSGTMADYKEAEKLPGELATSLEIVEEVMAHVAVVKKEDPTPHRRQMLHLVEALEQWLHHKLTEQGVHEAFQQLTASFPAIELGSHVTRAFAILTNARRAVLRISVISRTGFLSSGYALLEAILAVVYLILLVATFRSRLSEALIVCFVSLIYTYMYRLIKDIDDPFEYHEGGQAGAAEVELFPLTEYKARLVARIGAGASS